jgi:hypothetical protein
MVDVGDDAEVPDVGDGNLPDQTTPRLLLPVKFQGGQIPNKVTVSQLLMNIMLNVL